MFFIKMYYPPTSPCGNYLVTSVDAVAVFKHCFPAQDAAFWDLKPPDPVCKPFPNSAFLWSPWPLSH